MTIPTDLSYTDQHEWLTVAGDNARVFGRYVFHLQSEEAAVAAMRPGRWRR